jgi:hypothetical protein
MIINSCYVLAWDSWRSTFLPVYLDSELCFQCSQAVRLATAVRFDREFEACMWTQHRSPKAGRYRHAVKHLISCQTAVAARAITNVAGHPRVSPDVRRYLIPKRYLPPYWDYHFDKFIDKSAGATGATVVQNLCLMVFTIRS